MHGPCEHCPNPDKALWTSECRYKGSYPSRRAFVLSTFDAPCAMDAYDEGQAELNRRDARWNWTISLVFFIIPLGLLVWSAL